MLTKNDSMLRLQWNIACFFQIFRVDAAPVKFMQFYNIFLNMSVQQVE